jgi:hypothetical protein
MESREELALTKTVEQLKEFVEKKQFGEVVVKFESGHIVIVKVMKSIRV